MFWSIEIYLKGGAREFDKIFKNKWLGIKKHVFKADMQILFTGGTILNLRQAIKVRMLDQNLLFTVLV